MITWMWNLFFMYLYNRLVEKKHFHMFAFMEPSLISKPGSASVNERVVSLVNRFQSAPKGVFLLVPYNIR